MSRASLVERYEALPLPTTSDEHWRFTELKGFDPGAFSRDGSAGAVSAPAMLEVDVAGLAHASEGGIEIVRAPEGVTFEPLRDHKRLGTLVGADEKFAAHNAASW